MSAAEIAAGLSGPQRRAIKQLTGKEIHYGYASVTERGWRGPFRGAAFGSLCDRGLAEREYWAGRRWRRDPVPAGYRYRLTPVGLEVRAILEEQKP